VNAPARVVPEDIDAFSKIMRGFAESGATIAFEGGGTALGFGYDAERVDGVLSTARLDSVVAYAPDDFTVTAEAGVTLAALQATVAARGQRVALDAPDAARATLGGLVATNGFGPLRARYGTLRDLVLGATLVRADGVVVRGGGTVVKNVAGFDVPKLLVGSLGTLGCIARVTLRLHPLAEVAHTASVACPSAGDVWRLWASLVAAQLEPAAVVAVATDEGFALSVRFEGFAAGVQQQARAFAGCARSADLAEDVAADVDAVHDAARTARAVHVKAAYPASRFAEVDAAAFAPLRAALTRGAFAAYPSVGVAFAAGDADDADAACAALENARAAVEREGGSLVLLAAPQQVRARVDVYGTIPPSFALMRSIKERFDPQRICNRGRFIGKL
jgi:glycolate dehydrogenase FAD-binding subunit